MVDLLQKWIPYSRWIPHPLIPRRFPHHRNYATTTSHIQPLRGASRLGSPCTFAMGQLTVLKFPVEDPQRRIQELTHDERILFPLRREIHIHHFDQSNRRIVCYPVSLSPWQYPSSCLVLVYQYWCWYLSSSIIHNSNLANQEP